MEEVVLKLNQIYAGSIFQDYGIRFKVLKVLSTMSITFLNKSTKCPLGAHCDRHQRTYILI